VRTASEEEIAMVVQDELQNTYPLAVSPRGV
jgi:hypothetical protein